ncbi:MAG: SH3 domain-containing protein [Spirochaetaceae bacterium]|jgi:uncharacterized protein YraI|nr:SH3 domain-containing protein [Spirochaetaceae bacterium]
MTFEKAESIAKVTAIIIVVAVTVTIIVLFRPFISTIRMEKPAPAAVQTVIRKTASVTSNGLNLRAQPSANASIVKILRRGDRLSVTGEAQDGWLPVEHNGNSGWVNAQYITLE